MQNKKFWLIILLTLATAACQSATPKKEQQMLEKMLNIKAGMSRAQVKQYWQLANVEHPEAAISHYRFTHNGHLCQFDFHFNGNTLEKWWTNDPYCLALIRREEPLPRPVATPKKPSR